jgi:uncharacterized phage infection (PIP) family protein YhgE
MEKENKRSA